MQWYVCTSMPQLHWRRNQAFCATNTDDQQCSRRHGIAILFSGKSFCSYLLILTLKLLLTQEEKARDTVLGRKSESLSHVNVWGNLWSVLRKMNFGILMFRSLYGGNKWGRGGCQFVKLNVAQRQEKSFGLEKVVNFAVNIVQPK